MAKGPAPKDPEVRQRRNRASTAAQLARTAGRKRAPSLPRLRTPDGLPHRWEQQTRDWWYRVWHSPMAGEFIEADYDALASLAVLVDKRWKLGIAASPMLMAEIRQQELRFGLTPGDRKRLQWSVAKPAASASQPAKPGAIPGLVLRDPRALLSIAK